MLCAVVDLCCVRVVVVRVERTVLLEQRGLRVARDLQPRFGLLPIMLVSFDGPHMENAECFSEWPTSPYLAELVEWNSLEPVEWLPLPELVEPELPF